MGPFINRTQDSCNTSPPKSLFGRKDRENQLLAQRCAIVRVDAGQVTALARKAAVVPLTGGNTPATITTPLTASFQTHLLILTFLELVYIVVNLLIRIVNK
jgi:hypothetical protein